MFKQLDQRTFISGQIDPGQIEEARRLGVTMVINNRPDGEDPGQPTSAVMEQACTDCGVAYRHVPIARGMGPTDIAAMRDAIHATGEGKLLAYCRSGNRSTLAWAIAKREDGDSADDLTRAAEGAGFSLAPIQHLL